MFVSNNRASFHLWWIENLIKYEKVSKYYENDCGQTSATELLQKWLNALIIFAKNLHFRCLTSFWMHIWYGLDIRIKSIFISRRLSKCKQIYSFLFCLLTKNIIELIQFLVKFQTSMVLCSRFIMDRSSQQRCPIKKRCS